MKNLFNKLKSKEVTINQSNIIESQSNLDYFNLSKRIQSNYYFIQKLILIKIKNNLNKIIILFLSLLNYYLYYLSLEKCLEGFDNCGAKSDWILKKLTQAFISYFILTLLFELMILNKVSK